MMTVGERIRERLTELNWTQAHLAGRIGVSQSVISQYLSSTKKPAAETLSAISKELDISLASLLGEKDDNRSAMSTPSHELSWNERKAPDDGTRSYGNARAELFTSDNETLTAETGQNSNDASLGGEVEMEYRLTSVSGAALDRFLAAIRWEVLRPHYEIVANDSGHRTARRYKDTLRELEEDRRLWLLRIDDYNTSGLIGDDFSKGCFASLVRYSQDSQKTSESSGGRFGLGSASLSSASGFDLVLFLSNLAEPINGKTEGRLIGRAVFPYHQFVDGSEYEGPFFFGVADRELKSRRFSAWSSRDLRTILCLDREDERSGTSILIVGYRDPSGEDLTPQTAEDAIAAVSDAFENRFWPAISRGKLSAKFSRYDNDRLVSERRLDAQNIKHPFASLTSDAAELREQFVPLNVPRSKEGQSAAEHSARLVVDVLPDNASGPRVNELALVRGALMVVRYKSFPNLALGARPFRAALFCGTAAATNGQSSSSADIAAEVFLSKAEPPQHNDWTSRGTDLTAIYRGGKRELDRFLDSTRSMLRELISPALRDETQGPEALRKLVSIPGDPGPGKKVDIVSAQWQGSEYQKLELKVRLNFRKDRDRFVVRPHLFITTDGGADIELECHLEAARGTILAGSTLFSVEDVREATVLLCPDWSSVPVRPDLSAVKIDMSVIERSRI